MKSNATNLKDTFTKLEKDMIKNGIEKDELITLIDNNFSINKILEYLEENNIIVKSSTLSKYLKKELSARTLKRKKERETRVKKDIVKSTK